MPTPTVSVPVEGLATCPVPGGGYSIDLAYPVSTHPDIAGFAVTATVNTVPVDLGTWRSARDVPATLQPIGPATVVEIASRTVLDDGDRLPPRTTTLTTPPAPC